VARPASGLFFNRLPAANLAQSTFRFRKLRNLKNIFSTAWRNQLLFCRKAVKCEKYIFIAGFCSHFFGSENWLSNSKPKA